MRQQPCTALGSQLLSRASREPRTWSQDMRPDPALNGRLAAGPVTPDNAAGESLMLNNLHGANVFSGACGGCAASHDCERCLRRVHSLADVATGHGLPGH